MTENKITITVNNNLTSTIKAGDEYTLFKRVEVTKTLDALCGSFSFTTNANNLEAFPIKPWDNVTISVNGETVINGYITKRETSYDEGGHNITFGGHDGTKDLVDSTLSENTQYNAPITLDEVISKTVSFHGLSAFLPVETVIGTTLNFRDGDTISGDVGQSIFEFLDKCARKLGCILGTNQDGKIKIYRNDETETEFRKSNAVLLKNKSGESVNNTIKSATLKEDVNNRFSDIAVVSQGGLGGMSEMSSQGGNTDILSGLASDENIPRPRFKYIIADDSNDQDGLITMAEWEANKRRSDSIIYSCTTYGFSDPVGSLWNINNIYNIDDDFAFIRASMLIKSVAYRFDESEGSTTSLEFVTADAYTLQVNNPKIEENKIAVENKVKESRSNWIVDFARKFGTN